MDTIEETTTTTFSPVRRIGFYAGLLFFSLGLLTCGVDTCLSDPDDTLKARGRYLQLREYPPHTKVELKVTGPLSKAYTHLKGKKHLLRTDANGFILPTGTHKKPDLKIVCLGGLSTENRYLAEKERWPNQLRLALEKGHRKTNVYNAGIKGSHLLSQLDIFLHKIVPMRPDYVVWMFDIDELRMLLKDDAYWQPTPGFKRFYRMPQKHITYRSVFRDMFTLFWPKIGARMFRESEPPIKKVRSNLTTKKKIKARLQKSLSLLLTSANTFDIKMILLTTPTRLAPKPNVFAKKTILPWTLKTGFGYFDFQMLYYDINTTIRRLANIHNAKFIDLAGNVPPKEIFFHNLFDMSEAGAERAGQYIAKMLLKATKENSQAELEALEKKEQEKSQKEKKQNRPPRRQPKEEEE